MATPAIVPTLPLRRTTCVGNPRDALRCMGAETFDFRRGTSGESRIEDRRSRIEDYRSRIGELVRIFDPQSSILNLRSRGGHGGDDLMRTRIFCLGLVLTAAMGLAPTAA